MTASETERAVPPVVSPPSKTGFHVHSLKRILIFGTELGIAIGTKDLDVVIVRSRTTGPGVQAAISIRDFRTRPAAEWGSELLQFLAGAREKLAAATLVLPRDEVIVRVINLPGVADKDISAAVELQIETLHPHGDAEVVWGWTRINPASIVLGIVRQEVLTSYETLFSEAGVALRGVTFSASVIYASLRIWSSPPFSLLSWLPAERGRFELYGESPSRSLYSTELAVPLERALALARGELRIDPDYNAHALSEILPKSLSSHADFSPLAYAAATAASARFVTRIVNVLPVERRASSRRRQLFLPLALASLLALGAVAALFILPAIERRNYLEGLNTEIRRLEPAAQRAQDMDRRIKADRVRIAALDDFRRRPQADLDILNELTRILPPQVWTSQIEIYSDSVVLTGEADQAAPLLKIIDASPLFQNSDFALSMGRNGATQMEQFRIKTMRRNGTGRTTP